jgi:hypothetical protein
VRRHDEVGRLEVLGGIGMVRILECSRRYLRVAAGADAYDDGKHEISHGSLPAL